MARKMYKRLTQPVFDELGNQAHAPGDLIAADAPLDPAARYELVQLDVPDPPEPEPEPAPRGRRHATVQAAPAEGAASARP